MIQFRILPHLVHDGSSVVEVLDDGQLIAAVYATSGSVTVISQYFSDVEREGREFVRVHLDRSS